MVRQSGLGATRWTTHLAVPTTIPQALAAVSGVLETLACESHGADHHPPGPCCRELGLSVPQARVQRLGPALVYKGSATLAGPYTPQGTTDKLIA